MTIGILFCGDIPATLQAEFGGYCSMIRRLLRPRSTAVFDVQRGQLPRSTSTCEAYVITGSNAGVYDDLPWVKDLIALLRNARGGSKLIGIFRPSDHGSSFRRLCNQIAEGVGHRASSLRLTCPAALDG